jgi:hypothetical protein
MKKAVVGIVDNVAQAETAVTRHGLVRLAFAGGNIGSRAWCRLCVVSQCGVRGSGTFFNATTRSPQ